MSPLYQTTSLCRTCKNGVEAEVVERDGEILLCKTCPEHGYQEALISSDATWYHETMRYLAAPKPVPPRATSVRTGCPYDCGFCPSHQQGVFLPVVAITSACNLNCPICYTINRRDQPYHMPIEQFAGVLEQLKIADPATTIINITGGEPTLHPRFLDMMKMCADVGVRRVTISTHGLTFLENEDMLRRLSEMRARIILSFNSFHKETWKAMTGMDLLDRKLRVLDLLEKHDVHTTLIPVLSRGYNDRELGDLVRLLYQRPNLRSLEIHTITLTGFGGKAFDHDARFTTSDVIRAIQEQSGGLIATGDFVPAPAAHPLCYNTCYLLEDDTGGLIPFARFMAKDLYRELLGESLYIEPGERMNRVFQKVMMSLWAAKIPDATAKTVLKTLRALVQRLFTSEDLPFSERDAIAERAAKAIYIHSHMDEETFDTERIRQCCVAVPSGDGQWVPTCSYNVLYRERDVHFCPTGAHPIDRFTGGKKWMCDRC
jgi:7,8-dihydro-6-hydroxymethylpterin dimethyltransferase